VLRALHLLGDERLTINWILNFSHPLYCVTDKFYLSSSTELLFVSLLVSFSVLIKYQNCKIFVDYVSSVT